MRRIWLKGVRCSWVYAQGPPVLLDGGAGDFWNNILDERLCLSLHVVDRHILIRLLPCIKHAHDGARDIFHPHVIACFQLLVRLCRHLGGLDDNRIVRHILSKSWVGYLIDTSV